MKSYSYMLRFDRNTFPTPISSIERMTEPLEPPWSPHPTPGAPTPKDTWPRAMQTAHPVDEYQRVASSHNQHAAEPNRRRDAPPPIVDRCLLCNVRAAVSLLAYLLLTYLLLLMYLLQ